ncbi:MAG: DUF983 domain-containing protein [Bacteroidota bacterium]
MKKLPAVLKMKCPQCHEGDLFETSTWSFQKPFDMHKNCPNCQLDFFPEPGFYWGAMFISYIFWGWVSVFIGGACIMLLGMSVNQATLILIGFSAVFFIWLFRISRSIWIHIAVRRRNKKLKRT